MSEQNKALMRRTIEEIWNGENFAMLEEMVAADFVIHAATPEEEIHGPEGAKQFVKMLHNAMPDIHFVIGDQIAEGDREVTRWKAQGTHTRELMGMPASGKRVTLTATDIDRIANGKFVECWTTLNRASLMQQMGLVSAPGQTAQTTA